MKCSSTLEVQLPAGYFAFLFESGPQGPATRFQKVHQPVHFHVIFFLCAARKARREAHLHLGIKTTGEGGVAPDLNLAAPHFEKIESGFGERLRGAPRCKWTVVCAARGHARFVNRNPASQIAPRIGVPEIHLQHGGWPQAHQVAVALGKELLRVDVVGERLFKRRACQPVADAARERAQIQSLARGINGTQQPMQSPLQILRANQERLGFFFSRFN